ncbi:MAG: replicative DNA helicase [Deltaproteobacteria bacterium]|nr:replicative DNA helicase [Deltaproteobacteria bacterium]
MPFDDSLSEGLITSDDLAALTAPLPDDSHRNESASERTIDITLGGDNDAPLKPRAPAPSVIDHEPPQNNSPAFSGQGGRVPPHSQVAEQSVLGAIFLDNESINTVIEILRPDDFYKRQHQIMFEAMTNLTERLEPIDMITVTNELNALKAFDAAGGTEYLSHLVDVVPTAAHVQYYSRIVKEMSLRRKLIHEVTEIAHDAFNASGDIDSFIDSVEQKIFKVSDSRVNPSFVKVAEVVKGSIKEIEQLYISKKPLTGVPTGFADLDRMTFGFQPSDLVIIAGRPSMGKTALALSMAKNVAFDHNGAVAVFSLEMSKEQITMRMLCSEAKVSASKVRSGKLGESDFPKLVDAASRLAQANIFIDDTPAVSVLEMRAKARRLHREKPLSLIVVDYLQLMRGASLRPERREQEISEISGGLKALAKELRVPVVALSQLNRAVESRQDKRPMMSDLRESGAIEQDADLIGFVYRDEVYNPDTPDKGVAELIVGKHRNGPVGTVRLAFLGEFTLFENLAENNEYDYLGADLADGDELL